MLTGHKIRVFPEKFADRLRCIPQHGSILIDVAKCKLQFAGLTDPEEIPGPRSFKSSLAIRNPSLESFKILSLRSAVFALEQFTIIQ